MHLYSLNSNTNITGSERFRNILLTGGTQFSSSRYFFQGYEGDKPCQWQGHEGDKPCWWQGHEGDKPCRWQGHEGDKPCWSMNYWTHRIFWVLLTGFAYVALRTVLKSTVNVKSHLIFRIYIIVSGSTQKSAFNNFLPLRNQSDQCKHKLTTHTQTCKHTHAHTHTHTELLLS